MSERLLLLCDVQRLLSHEVSPSAELALGLTWQLAWSEGYDSTNPAHSDWALPWKWDSVAAVHLGFRIAGANQPVVSIATEPNTALELSATDRVKAVAVLDSAADRLNTVGAASFLIDSNNPDAMMPEEGHVVQLQSSTARTTAGLGFALNLSAWIKVPLASLPPGAWDAVNHTLAANAELVAIPVMRRGGVTFTPDTTGPTPSGMSPSGARFQWTTTRSSGVEPTLTASLQAVNVTLENKPDRYVQRRSGWIRKSLTSGANTFEAPAPGTHWPTALADRVEEAWDLPRILFDAVRNHASIPAFETYWQMIVAALRDRAGLGHIDTPDGEGLLRYALQLALRVGANPSTVDNPSSVEKLVRDGQLRSLQARLRAFEMTWYANDPTFAYKDWYNILRSLNPDLPDPANPIVASRLVSVQWRTNDGSPLLAASASPTFDVSWASDSVIAPTLSFSNVQGTLGISADGRAVFTFDLYQPAINRPIPRGWMSAVGTLPGPVTIESDRSDVTPAVAEALAPLMSLHTMLRNRTALQRAILPVWGKHANDTVKVPHLATSCPWFDTVRTTVVAATPTPTLARADGVGVGDIRPLDGRVWIVTVPSIEWRPWTVGNTALLEFAPSFDANGSHPNGVEALRLKIKWLAGHQIELQWLKLDTLGNLNTIISQPPLTLPNDIPFDVRVEWSRGSVPNAIAGKSFVRFGTSQLDGPILPDQTGFVFLGLRVMNPNATGPDLLAGAPNLLTAPKSLSDPRPDVQALAGAWNALPDPGLALWEQAQQPVNGSSQKKIEAVLERIDCAELLAASQVARLIPVWNWYDPRNPNYKLSFFENFKVFFKDLLNQVFRERFDSPTGMRSRSIYRDFWPAVDVSTLPTQVWALIDAQVNLEIDNLPLPNVTVASGYNAANEDRVRLPATHGLHMQVIEPATFESSQDADLDDDQLHASGFGIVIRQANPAAAGANPDDFLANEPWQLLNLADLGARDLTATAEPGPYLHYPRLDSHNARPTAISLPYQDNARLTMITYQNRHLMVVSPLVEIADDANFGNDDLHDDLYDAPFLRRMPAPPSAGYDWGRLPTLKFGQWYQALMFVLGNSGQLPEPLCRSEHPAALRTTLPSDMELGYVLLPTLPDPDSAWAHMRRYVYLRRVGVSLPRAFSANPLTQDAWLYDPISKTQNPKFTIPVLKEIPRDVLPLTRDWGLRGLSALQAEQRFFYDPESGLGTLRDPARWEVILPRVFVAGGDEADRPASGAYAFRLTVGLINKGTNCLVEFHRNLDVLDVTANATTNSATLISPDGGALQSGAIDLKVVFRAGDIAVSWRRSDRDEAWVDATAFSGVPAAGDLSWLSIRRPTAAITTSTTPNPATEDVLTFGSPMFASSAHADIAPVARPVADESAPIAILKPSLIAPDSLNGVTTPADVLAKWRPIFSPDPADDADRRDRMRFWIRLPGVDLDTWNAWIDMDRLIPTAQLPSEVPQFLLSFPRTHANYEMPHNRTRIWVQHHSRRQRLTSTEDQHEVSLDDPAVNLLVVELRPLRVDRMEKVWRFAWKPPVESGNTWNLLREVQRKLREFQIGVIGRINGFAAAEELSKVFGESAIQNWSEQIWSELQSHRMDISNTDAITLLLHEQEIWELKIYPAVRDLYFTPAGVPGRQRFHQDFTEPLTITHTDSTGSERYRLLPAWRVVLEVATSDVVLPARDFVSTVGTATATITGATNTTPIVITSAAHGLANGNVIKITGVMGNTAANGFWEVTNVTASNFELNNSVGNGIYTSNTGSWQRVPQLAERKGMNELALRKTVLDALLPRFDGRFATVSLRKPSPRTFRYASDLRLMRQVWRWTGRPVPPFPFIAAAAGLLDAIPDRAASDDFDSPEWPMVWDAAGFGDRSSIDLIDEVRLLSAVNASADLFREDLGSDLRTIYYRFSAQAKSRYASLYPELDAQGSSEHFQQPDPADPNHDPDQEVDDRNAWRRLLVPARRQDELPRPPVRFVVPLTEPEDDKAHTPGLLVVLDDAWYRFGGLAETLDADVVEAPDYFGTTGTGAPLMRPEFGPDPILSPDGWTRQLVDGVSGDFDPPTRPLNMQVVGPIGYAFDTDAGAPLYNASSFILRPPVVLGWGAPGEQLPLDWYFVKVRFRRCLIPESHADYRTTPPVALSGTDDTDLILQADRAWVVDCPNVRVRSGVPTDLAMTLTDDPALPGGTDIPASSRGTLRLRGTSALTLTWTPQGAGSPTATIDVTSPGWSDVAIDFRIVLSLDARLTTSSDPGPKPQPRHTAILYRVRQRRNAEILPTPMTSGVWHRLVAWGWSSNDSRAWPNRIHRQASGDITASNPLAFLARMSSFTAPQWVQFLPDAQRLGNVLTNSVRTNRYVLRWDSADGVPQTRSGLLLEITPENEAGSDITASRLQPAARSPMPGGDVIFQRALLITEVISDIRGILGHERYVGLYSFDTGILERVHPGPRVDARVPATRRLRARLIEFQLVHWNSPRVTWNDLFPDQPDLPGDDIRARIVSVSPPLEVTTE